MQPYQLNNEGNSLRSQNVGCESAEQFSPHSFVKNMVIRFETADNETSLKPEVYTSHKKNATVSSPVLTLSASGEFAEVVADSGTRSDESVLEITAAEASSNFNSVLIFQSKSASSIHVTEEDELPSKTEVNDRVRPIPTPRKKHVAAEHCAQVPAMQISCGDVACHVTAIGQPRQQVTEVGDLKLTETLLSETELTSLESSTGKSDTSVSCSTQEFKQQLQKLLDPKLKPKPNKPLVTLAKPKITNKIKLLPPQSVTKGLKTDLTNVTGNGPNCTMTVNTVISQTTLPCDKHVKQYETSEVEPCSAEDGSSLSAAQRATCMESGGCCSSSLSKRDSILMSHRY
jgi:hypothetical protein